LINFYARTVRVTVDINMYITFFNLLKKNYMRMLFNHL